MMRGPADEAADAVEWAIGQARMSEQTFNAAQVSMAVQVIRDNIRFLPATGAVRAWAEGCLADALEIQYELTSAAEALDEAIEQYRRSIALRPADDPQAVKMLVNLSLALVRRYEARGAEPDLVDAIAAVGPACSGHADIDRAVLPYARSALGVALFRRFESSGDRADLDRAIDLLQQVWRCDATDVAATAAVTLSAAVIRRGEATGAAADYAQGIDLLRWVVDRVPPSHPVGQSALGNLGTALIRLYDVTGSLSTLEEALATARTAVRVLPPQHVTYAATLSVLVTTAQLRFARTGDRDALDEAVSAARTAVRLTPTGHVERGIALLELGQLLRTRFEALGATTDLDEANALLDEAVGITGSGRVDSAVAIGQLGVGLLRQHELTGDPGCLARAVELLRAAATSADSHHLPMHLGNLGIALVRQGDAARLDEAIDMFGRALTASGPGEADTIRANLGTAYLDRFSRTGVRADLDRGIEALGEACGRMAPDDPRLVVPASNLGTALCLRFDLAGAAGAAAEGADAERAIAAYQAGAGCQTAAAAIRARSAWGWGATAATLGRFDDGLRGYEVAVGLLDLVAWRGLAAGDQERLLIDFGNLARHAAACAVAAGEPERAVELLEQGRGVLLSQALDGRSSYEVLRDARPDLADQFAGVMAALDQPDPDLGLIVAGPGDDVRRERRMALARQREALLAEIRRHDGLADFLLPPTFDSVRPRAGDGPVVVVNVALLRSDALIITADAVRVVELPDDLDEQVARRVADLLDASVDSDAGEPVLADILSWLWDTICRPVLDAVDQDGGPVPVRLWWCPTGLLGLLPLHAAGLPPRAAGPPGMSTLDHAISSYTPTLRMLRRGRLAGALAAWDKGVLVVIPDPDEQAPVPAAQRAARAIPDGIAVTTLAGAAASTANVLSQLADHPWVHFAGHGAQDLANPSNGRLALTDGPLIVRTIAQRRLERAALAFLAACETARGGQALADEVITLTTAMQIAGFPHVIGTLWAVVDAAAARLAVSFYELIDRAGPRSGDAGNSAAALREATMLLRARYPSHPFSWAGFVHSGP